MSMLNYVLILICMASAFVFMFCFTNIAICWNRKQKISGNQLFNNNNFIKISFMWLMRNGFNPFKKFSNFILYKVLFVRKSISYVVKYLKHKNIDCNCVTLLSSLMLCAAVTLIVLSIVLNSFLAALAIVFCAIACFFSYIKSSMEKSIKVLREQIPQTLRFMSSCFGAGYTILQTFSQIAKDSDGKIKNVFESAYNILQTGGSVSDSLNVLKKESDLSELSFIAVALDVQHQTGGSIQPVIDSAKEMTENKLALLRMLNVQTAQAKLSAKIVMILPFALIALFSIISPGFLTQFFTSAMGIIIFLIACVMQAAGIILVKKILDINL